jgi:hypothetical protein
MVTNSDPGWENYEVANLQTLFRQAYDPLLEGTLQHRFLREKLNVKPEIEWGVLRRLFSPGFEDILEDGVQSELFDPSDPLHVCVSIVWRI